MSSNNKRATAGRERPKQRKRRRGKSFGAELMEIGKRCAAHIKMPVKSSDHAGMLYDKNGLPR